MVHTDSTGGLAPLNGTILAGIDDIRPDERIITLREWESGIGNFRIMPLQGEESQMNTITMTPELPP